MKKKIFQWICNIFIRKPTIISKINLICHFFWKHALLHGCTHQYNLLYLCWIICKEITRKWSRKITRKVSYLRNGEGKTNTVRWKMNMNNKHSTVKTHSFHGDGIHLLQLFQINFHWACNIWIKHTTKESVHLSEIWYHYMIRNKNNW